EIRRNPLECPCTAAEQVVPRQISVVLRRRVFVRSIHYRHLKILNAIPKQRTIQTTSTPSCDIMPVNGTPRSMLARSASFVAVSGSALMNGCTTRGKFSDETKTH